MKVLIFKKLKFKFVIIYNWEFLMQNKLTGKVKNSLCQEEYM